MKIFVLTACAQNPEEKLYLNEAQNGFAPDIQTRMINDFDQIGVETAVRLMESDAANDVTVFHIGNDKTLLYKALAIGASQAVMVDADETRITPQHVVDAVLRACPDPANTLFICGKLNVNFESAQTAQRLAQALKCPCVPCAKAITPCPDGSLDIACEDDQGTPHYNAHPPLVVTTDLRLAEVRFPSLPNIMKAKRKPVLNTEFVHSPACDWMTETSSIRETPKSNRKCTFITLDQALDIIRSARDNCAAHSGAQSLVPLPRLHELYNPSPLSILYVDSNESISDSRLEQFSQFAASSKTTPVILTSSSCPRDLVNAAQTHHIQIAGITMPEPFIASQVASSMTNALRDYPVQAILAAHSPRNCQILAQLAAATQIVFCPNLTACDNHPARIISAGSYIELLKPFKLPFCATLCDTSPLRFDTPSPRLLPCNPFYSASLTAFEPLSHESSPESAHIIFSVGRGAATHLDTIRRLANQYGAALGASRVVVDMGLLDNSHQIGLTGHSVAPDLYVAFGISGAIQHQAGLRNAPKILAVNTDKNAPILDFAHFALIDDVTNLIKRL